MINEASGVRLWRMMDLVGHHHGHAIKDVEGSFKATFSRDDDVVAFALEVQDKYNAHIDVRGKTVFVWESKSARLIAKLVELDANPLKDGDFGYSNLEGDTDEVTPPGWEPTVKKMKKHGIENPWRLAWWMKGKGYTPGGKK